MSIHDLKSRLADVPGIETLTMQNLVGRHVYGFNGLIAAVDPSATPQEIEEAIRAVALNRTMNPPDASNIPAMVPYTPLPPVNLTEAKPMSDSSPTGFVPGEISGLFKSLRARKDAMVADIMANGAEVANILTAGEQMAANLKAEGEALKAEFATLTNNPPA